MYDSRNIVPKNEFLFNRSKVQEVVSSIPGSRIHVSTSFLSA